MNRTRSYFNWTVLLSLVLTAVMPLLAKADFSLPRARSLLNTAVTHHGPNCWNSALVTSGVLPHIRFTSANEFQFLIDSPLCMVIRPGEQQRGDLQIYRRTLSGLSLKDREVHANIWLDTNTAFNKKTDFSTSRYELTEHKNVDAAYLTTSKILKFNLSDGRKGVHCEGLDCENQIEYRRCGNIENLKKADVHYSDYLEQLILSLEMNIESQVQSPVKPSDLWKEQSLRQLEEISAAIKATCAEEKSFYCDSRRHAIASLHRQLTRPQPNWLQ